MLIQLTGDQFASNHEQTLALIESTGGDLVIMDQLWVRPIHSLRYCRKSQQWFELLPSDIDNSGVDWNPVPRSYVHVVIIYACLMRSIRRKERAIRDDHAKDPLSPWLTTRLENRWQDNTQEPRAVPHVDAAEHCFAG